MKRTGDIDTSLLNHARLGLQRIHTISQPAQNIKGRNDASKSISGIP